jgi:ATP-dependent helicase/nuclease subunit A
MNSDAPEKKPPDAAAREAAETHIDSHMLLEAGAGSGKTTVLVARYKHIVGVTDAGVERVAAVTFTNKAAREMKERLQRDMPDMVRALETAPISTIHSLCEGLLKQYPFAAGVDPQFGVIDDRQRTVQLPRVVGDSLLRGLEEGRATAAMVVGQFEGLAAAVDAIVRLIDKRELYAKWLENPPGAKDLWNRWAEIEREWAAGFPAWVLSLPEYGELLSALGEMAPTAEAAPEDALSKHVRDLLGNLTAELPGDLEGIEEWSASGFPLPGNKGKAKTWGGDDELKAVRGRLRDATSSFRDGRMLKALGGLPEPSPRTAELAAAIWAEAKEALEAWQRHKDMLPALDFDDLQGYTRKLLADQKVRREIQRRFRHILVDEFQDTNELQRDIIWRLAGLDERGDEAARVFVVGDAKQSIYRFRNADVTVYTRTREDFKARQGCEVERLDVSFRPHAGLMEFFNELFKRDEIMGEGVEQPFEAAYEPMKEMRGAAPVAPCALGLLTVGGDEDDLLHRRLGEARTIAALIGEKLLGKTRPLIFDHRSRAKDPKDKWRRLEAGDIAILFRASRDMYLFEDALAERGLPYYNASGRGFFTRPEVLDMVGALRVVANPEDAVALVGVLRSPMFAVSDVALFWLGRAEENWWKRLRRAAEEGAWAEAPYSHVPIEERGGLRRAAELLGRWREVRDRLPISALMEEILGETGYSAAMAAQPDGLRAAANLGKLLDMARDFEGSAMGGLGAFVEMMGELAERDEGEAQAPTEEEEGEGIRLSTIHGAKGLQWPVVVVADLGRGQNEGRDVPLLQMHPEYGIVPAEVEQYRPRRWRLAGELIAQREDLEEEAETRRLLYVALTRASDMLVMSSSLAVQGEEEKVARRPGGGTWLAALLAACGCREKLDGRKAPAGAEDLGASLGTWYVTAGAKEKDGLPPVEILMAAPEPPEKAEDQAAAPRADFTMALTSVPPDPSARERFSVSELADYLHCPRGYWLRHVEGLAEGAARLPDPARALSAVERGTMAHQVLQMAGTGGAAALAEVLGRALPGGRDLRVIEEEEVEHLRELVAWYLASDFYRERVAAAGTKLRTEAWVSFELAGALVEGKMDAVAEGAGGRVLIDYKTGRASAALADEGEPARDVFQISVYALGLHEVTGEWPAEGVVVYLSDRKIEPIRPEADGRAAKAEAEDAIEHIRQGSFFGSTGDAGKCEECRMRWACSAGSARRNDVNSQEG